MITLKYRINGVLFRREYARSEVQAATDRIATLVRSGISVVIRGLPKLAA